MSELVWGDLNNFFIKKREEFNFSDPFFWECLLTDIFKAIHDLQTHLNVVHHDLHLGNILVILYEDHINILIHDFGRSYKVTDRWTRDDRLFDVERVCDSLLRLDIIPDEIRNRLIHLTDFVRDLKENINYIDMVIDKWLLI